MNPCELVTFVSAMACAIAKCCDTNELSVLSAVFTQLGDSLATILAQTDFCKSSQISPADSSSQDKKGVAFSTPPDFAK